MFIPISQLLLSWELSIGCQLYRLCSCKEFFVSQMFSLLVLLKNKGYPLRILLKKIRGLLNKGKIHFGISAFGVSQMIVCKWRASCKPTWSLFFPAVLFYVCCLSCCVFLFYISLCCCLLLASSMPESSCCFQICSRNSVHRLVFSLAVTHCRELMKLVGRL